MLNSFECLPDTFYLLVSGPVLQVLTTLFPISVQHFSAIGQCLIITIIMITPRKFFTPWLADDLLLKFE